MSTQNFVSLSLSICFLVFIRSAFSTQTCYHCNYYAASSNDPGIQTALTVLQSRQPAYTQCGNFPYYSRSSVPTIDCNSLNASAYYTNGFGGMPFTGWMCAKQSYTMTLKNYVTGNTVSVPVTVRGCVPYQWGNPYYYTTCWNIESSLINPYVRAFYHTLYFPQNNVGPVSGSISGKICQCGGSWCNSAHSLRVESGFQLALGLITSSLMIMVMH